MIQEVAVECSDAARLAQFWGELLQRPWGYRTEPGGVVDAGDMFLFFQQVPASELSAGNRLHLDIEVDDIEQAAVRAEALGATRTGEHFDDPAGGGYITLRDPEGNAFCVVSQPDGDWSRLLSAIANETPASAQ